MEVEVGGCFLCLGVKTPVGQAEMAADNYTTPDLKKTVMREAEIGIIKETAWGDWWLRGGWEGGGQGVNGQGLVTRSGHGKKGRGANGWMLARN